MGLSKEIKLTVKDYDLELSRPLKFYKNDSLVLKFEINEFGIIIDNGIRKRSVMPITPLIAKLLIETPEGVDYTEATTIINNQVTFKVTSKFTQNVGITRMQIILKDNDGCRITLPEMQMEIREPIGNEVISSDVAVCGQFVCGQLLCGQGANTFENKTLKVEITRSLSEEFLERFGGEL